MARPFIYVDKVSLSANGSDFIKIEMGATEKGTIKVISFKSTGTFQIEEILDGAGNRYSNCSSNDPIPRELFLIEKAINKGGVELPIPIELPPKQTLSIKVKDTSGSSNDVYFIGIGTREPA